MDDRIIRGGTLVDGIGADAHTGDASIEDSQIAAVVRIGGRTREGIEADRRTGRLLRGRSPATG